MAKTTEKVRDQAGNVKPYIDRAVHDEDLRDNVLTAFAAAREVYDELIDNYSRDGRFDPEGLRVLVDSLVEMGALKSADAKALYTEEYLPSR